MDGTCLNQDALHPVAMLVTTAQASLAILGRSDDEAAIKLAWDWVERMWNEPLRQGDRRYYDNCLYVFAFLALSGKYRIW